MKKYFDFDEIRPYYDEEVSQALEKITQEPLFEALAKKLFPQTPYEQFRAHFASIDSTHRLQHEVMIVFLNNLARQTATSLTLGGVDRISPKKSYLYITNHRDIILDSAFLSILLAQYKIDTPEIAIGDNLLVYPWIEDMVRANKSFVVKREVSVRRMMDISRRLSSYILFAIQIKHQSVWVAQREGRAKDANDRTQEALLKMLNLSGNGSVIENLMQLNIAPIALSYEYDPCDYLKAKEFQQKRDNPDFKKSPQDDLLNMQTGLMGYKGNIHFEITPPINTTLDTQTPVSDKAEAYSRVAQCIDRQIHTAYRIYPGNHVALDLLHGTTTQCAHYTFAEKETFEAYLSQQIAKIELQDKDESFLRTKLLEMYSNPLINQIAATR